MWLRTFLTCFLLGFKPSAADFGLFVSIPNLRSIVDATIADGVQPMNRALREMQLLTQEHPFAFQMTLSMQDALANATQMLASVFKSVRGAVMEVGNGPRKTFDRLYSTMNVVNRQLPMVREMVQPWQELFYGSYRIQFMSDSWNALEKGLNALNKSLASLDQSIATGQRKTTITVANIGEFVVPKQIAAFKNSLQMLTGLVGRLNKQTSELFTLFRMTVTEKSNAGSLFDKMFDFSRINQTTIATIDRIQNSLHEMTRNLNKSVLSGYQPLLKTRMIDNRGRIEQFLGQFKSILLTMIQTVALFKDSLLQKIVDKLSTIVPNTRREILLEVDNAFQQALKNSSLAEVCGEKHPLIDDSLSEIVNLTVSCIRQELNYLPRIAELIQGSNKWIRSMLLSPIEDLKMCTTKLQEKLCYPSFAATYLSESNGTIYTPLAQSFAKRWNETDAMVTNEIGSAYARIDSCTSWSLTAFSLEALRIGRMDCYEGYPTRRKSAQNWGLYSSRVSRNRNKVKQ